MKRLFKKKHNSGMTLLEVIVAVSIFAIAAVVLLQGFVTSGTINKKSGLYLEATSTAQNIMEELKSKDFEEIVLAFNYPVDNNGISRFSLLKNAVNTATINELIKLDTGGYKLANTNGELGKSDSSSILIQESSEEGKQYVLNPKTSSQYFFQMRNIRNEKYTFDALVELDGKQYRSDSKIEKKKNDQEIPNIARLDRKENVFLIMHEDRLSPSTGEGTTEYKKIEELRKYLHESAVLNWKDKKNEYEQAMGKVPPDTTVEEPGPEPKIEEWNHNEISEMAKRTITIKIAEGGSSVKYDYEIDINEYVDKKDMHDYGNVLDRDKLKDKIEDQDLGGKRGLKGIYIFYYPNYNSTSNERTKALDNIIIKNPDNVALNLYVVKEQISDSVLLEKGIQLSSAENRYRMNLEIHENPTESAKDKVIGAIKLRTNLNYNLSEDILERKEMNLNNWQMRFAYYWDKYDVRTPIEVPYESINRIKRLVDYAGLDDKEVKDRIYNVKITLYKHVDGKEPTFSEEDKVVTLEGSRDD